MSNSVIKVEDLGKLYRLGEINTGTLSQDLKRWWAITRGKEDPFTKVGETNVREAKGSSDYVWALKNVNFELGQGEVLGIIGRNGAGKSTLLKLLSKVTKPTTGRIKIKGRIASLLEVGTGFHPDLTGRENIFLNGAILGMSKVEVRSKFDAIVDFAGVERYIDTPVKRYSSGMYVRLAFAVAAFLEPEILIVDEVLAVGDAEFQKKCLGRMKSVSENDGRTVLFVSHNMGAVKALCSQGLYLQNGTVEYLGGIENVIGKYLLSTSLNSYYSYDESSLKVEDEYVQLLYLSLTDKRNNLITDCFNNDEVGVKIKYRVKKEGAKPVATFALCDQFDTIIFMSVSPFEDYKVGEYSYTAWLPPNFLNDIEYVFKVGITTLNPVNIHLQHEIRLKVIDNHSEEFRKDYKEKYHGLIRPNIDWVK